MTINNTFGNVIIEVDPSDPRDLAATLNVADVLLASSDAALQELTNLLAADTTSPPSAVVSEIVQSAISLILDAKIRVLAVKNALEVAGGAK